MLLSSQLPSSLLDIPIAGRRERATGELTPPIGERTLNVSLSLIGGVVFNHSGFSSFTDTSPVLSPSSAHESRQRRKSFPSTGAVKVPMSLSSIGSLSW